MRIAFVNSSIDEYGGVERGILELGGRLRRKGHEVLYYSWYYDDAHSDERYKDHVVRQTWLGPISRLVTRTFHRHIGNVSPNLMGVPFSVLTNVPLLTKAICESRPDFIYLPVGHSLAGLVAKVHRTQLVCYFAYFPAILTTESVLSKLMRPFERYTVTNSICFANSKYLASYIMKRLGVDNIKALHPGGNTSRFSTIQKEDDGKTLLHFARFSPEKWRGHSFLLRLLCLLSGSDVRLILAGGLRRGLEPYLQRLASTIRKFDLKDRVELVTNVPEDQVPRLYSRATLYVDPNAYDYSMSIVEALAAGVPALVRSEGGQAEPVVHGETGFYVSGNLEDWACSIRMLLGSPDLISRMSSKARLRAREFSWDRAADKLESEMLRVKRTNR